MGKIDLMRRGTYAVIFLAFFGFTIKYYDYVPNPYWLTEEEKVVWNNAKVPEDEFQDGDLIVRLGQGFISDAILGFEGNTEYSHSGIIRKINGQTVVCHAIGAEENVVNKVRRDKLEIFCHPRSVRKFAVYRYDLDPETQKKFIYEMDEFYKKGYEFDMDFDMETEDLVYCSEMIYKALAKATGDPEYVKLSLVMDKSYMAIDNLYLNDHCNLIFKYSYD